MTITIWAVKRQLAMISMGNRINLKITMKLHMITMDSKLKKLLLMISMDKKKIRKIIMNTHMTTQICMAKRQ